MTTSAAKPAAAQPSAPQSVAPQTAEAQPAEAKTEEQGGQVLHMHRAHPALPYMTAGDLKASAQAMAARTPGLPARDLVFYGGLGALTVAGALEWPVALAVGGAAFVLRGRGRKETKADERQTAAPGTATQEGAQQTQTG